MSLSGDVLFGNGGDWKKTKPGEGRKSMANVTSMANETSTVNETQENATDQTINSIQENATNQTSNASAASSANSDPGVAPLDGSDFMNTSVNGNSSVNSLYVTSYLTEIQRSTTAGMDGFHDAVQ